MPLDEQNRERMRQRQDQQEFGAIQNADDQDRHHWMRRTAGRRVASPRGGGPMAARNCGLFSFIAAIPALSARKPRGDMVD